MEETQSVNERNKEIVIPERTSSKRFLALEDERNDMNDHIFRARKKLKPKASFDAEFWSRAAKIEQITLGRSEVQKKISLREFIKDGGNEVEWQNTDKARELFEEIRAQQTTIKICERQAEKLDENKRHKRRFFRSSFMKLFTTSTMGLGIEAGAGKRDKSQQSNFRTAMIDAYESSCPGRERWLWCPIFGEWVHSPGMVAAHLFAYMHGQQTMDSIFGKTKTPELFSPRNGLLISGIIEEVFDSGFLVIVPQLPDRPTKAQLAGWLMNSPREYKIRVIDSSGKLDIPIRPGHDMRWRDLDNKPLVFRGNFRPAARYLYFHYCLQILRRAWKQSPKEPNLIITDEIGKPYWGTPGRYLPRNMLLAFVEELGHEYDSLLEGACCSSGDDEVLLGAASAQVKANDPSKSDGDDDSEDSDEDGYDGDSENNESDEESGLL